MRKLIPILIPVFLLNISFTKELDRLLKVLEEKGIITEEDIKKIKKKKRGKIKVKIRLQPRIDSGDIYKEGNEFKNRSDFYLRRVRLEVSKKWKVSLGKSIKLKVVIDGDKGERDYNFRTGKKKHRKFDADIKYAYVEWDVEDYFEVVLGKKKKPYSRVSLTSSSRQLLIERPFSTEDAKDWLGKYDGNQIMIKGKFLEGVFKYAIAVSDGSTIEREQSAGENVVSDVNVGNFIALRIELSPPGLTEKKKDDTGIGYFKHKRPSLVFGFSYAENRNFDVDTDGDINNGYEVKDEKGKVIGGDVFGRLKLFEGILTLQGEYVYMEYEKTDRKEEGWYVQGGYLIRLDKTALEPAFRYEKQSIFYSSERREAITLGFNHYLKGHKVKWAYNFLLINNSPGDDQKVHQVQAQFYF